MQADDSFRHLSLSFAVLMQSVIGIPVHSSMSSVHLLRGLPFSFFLEFFYVLVALTQS